MRSLVLLLIFFLASSTLHPQSAPPLNKRLSANLYSIQFSYQRGGIFRTNDFVSGKNSGGVPLNYYDGLSFRLAKQTTGTKLWEQVYGYPLYGIEFLTGDFKTEELGKPMAVLGFLSGPFFRIRHFSFGYNLGLGLAFHWNKHNPRTNPNNIAIGSDINAMVDAGVAAEVMVLPRVNLSAGYGLTHFSNGGITLPNKGLNTHFWKAGLRYELYSGNPPRAGSPIEKFKDVNEWLLAGYTGFRNALIPDSAELYREPITVPLREQPTIPVFSMGIIATYHRQLDYKSKLGAGFQIGYNGLVDPSFEWDGDSVRLNRKPDIRRLELHLFPSYELTINKICIMVEAGFSVHRDELIRSGPDFFQRLGFKYYLTDQVFAAVHIRARKFGKADMIEWSVGYRFRRSS